MPCGPCFGVELHFSRSEGAILLLAAGARRVDYRGLPDIRDYATKNAESWYRYVTDQVRMDAYNGSLYCRGCILLEGEYDLRHTWGRKLDC